MDNTLLNTLFPESSFTARELQEIEVALDQPAVKKYLKNWAIAGIKGIANGMPKPGETADQYLQREAIVKGNLEVIEKLLSIQKTAASA